MPSLAPQMRILTNPQFDDSVDPQENEFAYVNPVRLNNDLIKLANHMLTLAEAKVEAVKAVKKARFQKRKLQREQDDLERQLLRDQPLAPSEAKSLKTIAAATMRRVQAEGFDQAWAAREAEIRACEDVIDHQDTIIETSTIYWDTADKMTESIKTHLSYVKDEARRAQQHGVYGR